jgi:hypothetical protein
MKSNVTWLTPDPLVVCHFVHVTHLIFETRSSTLWLHRCNLLMLSVEHPSNSRWTAALLDDLLFMHRPIHTASL